MITLNVDGAARNNPGLAGIGIYLRSNEKVLLEDKAYIGERTNNEAEYIALIIGLEKATDFGNHIRVISDSELIVNQVKGVYKVKQPHLKGLLERVKQLQSNFSHFEIEHQEREKNKEADRLANEAIDEFKKGEREETEIHLQKQEKLF